jgi:hypothetical protein
MTIRNTPAVKQASDACYLFITFFYPDSLHSNLKRGDQQCQSHDFGLGCNTNTEENVMPF